jgi:acyl carrier protein
VTTTQTDLDEIEEAILAFFDEKGGLPGETSAAKLNCAYLEAGVVTSVGLVELVMMLERRFGVRFQAADMQSQEFQTVRGLAAIVRRRAVDVP